MSGGLAVGSAGPQVAVTVLNVPLAGDVCHAAAAVGRSGRHRPPASPQPVASGGRYNGRCDGGGWRCRRRGCRVRDSNGGAAAIAGGSAEWRRHDGWQRWRLWRRSTGPPVAAAARAHGRSESRDHRIIVAPLPQHGAAADRGRPLRAVTSAAPPPRHRRRTAAAATPPPPPLSPPQWQLRRRPAPSAPP